MGARFFSRALGFVVLGLKKWKFKLKTRESKGP